MTMTLNDLLGNNDEPWMVEPGRPCACPVDAPDFIRDWSDKWFKEHPSDEQAAEFCAGCPVISQCFAYAMGNPELEGILGGTTHLARKRARKRAQRRALRKAAA